MSVSFEIASSIKPYKVTISQGSFDVEMSGKKNSALICDSYFESRLNTSGVPIIPLPATEATKTLERMADVVVRMREIGLSRNSVVGAVGGGSVQDVATFCCSIYMRGISWRYMPSTLLGMVDSCVGGKSAINVGHYKNLVGNFYPPQEVVIDPGLIESLPVEQRVAGLCEAAKIAFAHNQDTFEAYLDFMPGPSLNGKDFVGLIELSLRAKKWFIEIDEFDERERLLLNFGHTFGHAIESASNFSIPHGIAVGIGILVALDFSREGLKIREQPPCVVALQSHIQELLSWVDGLDECIVKLQSEDLLKHFESDKKHKAESYTIVTINRVGALERYSVGRTEYNRRLILASFDFALSGLR